MKATEKLAYLKGLAEGYGIMEDKKEQKLLNLAFELVEELTEEIESLNDRLEVQELFVEELGDALTDLEDEFYGEYDDEDEDYEDDDEFCDCGCGGGYDEDEDEELGDVFDITCPNCEESYTVDEGVVGLGVISCPFCGERLEIEGVIDEEEEEGCGCGGHAHSHSYPVDYEGITGGGCGPSDCSTCGCGCGGGYDEEEYYGDEEEEEDK